jgi:hypothetical protein
MDTDVHGWGKGRIFATEAPTRLRLTSARRVDGEFQIGDLKFRRVHGPALAAPLQTPAFSVSSTESFSTSEAERKSYGDVLWENRKRWNEEVIHSL